MENFIKFTKDQLSYIMYEGGIQDEDDNWVYQVVKEKIIDFDREKGSVDKEFVIKEAKTGKKYKAILGDSEWCDQDKENAKQKWYEVIPKPKKKKIISKNI